MQGTFRFSFGPWNIHEGADPFGPEVRRTIPFNKKLDFYKKLGFDGVQFHDDDAVPGMANMTPAAMFKASQQGQVAPMTSVSAPKNVTSFPWTEGFETGTATGFTFIDSDGDTYGWEVYDFGTTAQGHNGIARAVRPAHSIYDGDTVFALCSGRVAATPDSVGVLAAKAAEAAIVDAIRSAATCGDYLSCAERLERLSR